MCSGAEPLAITNCLNFGNPNDPEVYCQFRESVLGIGEMCRALDTPVTGGNVSFYNETSTSAVYPTPVIGMVGVLDDLSQKTTLDYKNEGDLIITIGMANGALGGSEYLKTIHGKVEGPISKVDIDLEMKVQSVCLQAIKEGIINSAHDISDGGLAVNVSESIVSAKEGIGAKLAIHRKLRDDEILFGECQSVIIVTISEENLHKLILIAKEVDVSTQTIGKVTNNGRLVINDWVSIDRSDISDAYFNSLENRINND